MFEVAPPSDKYEVMTTVARSSSSASFPPIVCTIIFASSANACSASVRIALCLGIAKVEVEEALIGLDLVRPACPLVLLTRAVQNAWLGANAVVVIVVSVVGTILYS